jgi:hypothetical protein
MDPVEQLPNSSLADKFFGKLPTFVVISLTVLFLVLLVVFIQTDLFTRLGALALFLLFLVFVLSFFALTAAIYLRALYFSKRKV